MIYLCFVVLPWVDSRNEVSTSKREESETLSVELGFFA